MDETQAVGNRMKYWEEKSDTEKIEYLAKIVINQQQEMSDMREQVWKLHSVEMVNGKPMLPLHSGNIATPRCNPDWVLNRRPQ